LISSGRAVNMSVLKSMGLGLDENAMRAVNQWRFKPGEKDGKPVSVWVTIELAFRLR
jgi:TonB family protein